MGSKTDISAFAATFPQLLEKQRQKVIEGAIDVCEGVKTMSQELCPIDSKTLYDSASIIEPVIRNGVLQTGVGYDTPYAAAVHENLEAIFNTVKSPMAQAKFLETAQLYYKPLAAGIIQARLDA